MIWKAITLFHFVLRTSQMFAQATGCIRKVISYSSPCLWTKSSISRVRPCTKMRGMQQKQMPVDLPRKLSGIEKMTFKTSHRLLHFFFLINWVKINSVFTGNATSMVPVNKPCPNILCILLFLFCSQESEIAQSFSELTTQHFRAIH